MKKILLFSLLLGTALCLNAQITILSKHAEFFALDQDLDEYVRNEDGGEIDIYFILSEDTESVSVNIAGEDEILVILWKYLPDFSSETEEAYSTEDGDFVIFDYKERRILWYYDYNQALEGFEFLDVMSEFEIIKQP